MYLTEIKQTFKWGEIFCGRVAQGNSQKGVEKSKSELEMQNTHFTSCIPCMPGTWVLCCTQTHWCKGQLKNQPSEVVPGSFFFNSFWHLLVNEPLSCQPQSPAITLLSLVTLLRQLTPSGSRIFLNQALKLFWYLVILVYSPIEFQQKCPSQSPFISVLYRVVFVRAAGNKIACYMPTKVHLS